MSNLKLQKLLYFVQAYFLIKKQGACFRESIEAWDFGPVVTVAYREYKKFGSCNIPEIKYITKEDGGGIWNTRTIPYFDIIITDYDKKLIDAVTDKFSGYSSTNLVSLTQRQKPWIDAYSPYKINEITIEAIEEFFNT